MKIRNILLKRDILWIAALVVFQIKGPTIFTWGPANVTVTWIIGTILLVTYGIVWTKSDRKSRWTPRKQP